MYKKIKTPFLLISVTVILTPYFLAKALKTINRKENLPKIHKYIKDK